MQPNCELPADSLENYIRRTGHSLEEIKAVLFDMDGVLYDSMPGHAKAWKAMCDSVGIKASSDEFYAYEGRTGASTINLLYQRQYGRGADDQTCRRLYAIKSDNFRKMGLPPLMPGAKKALDVVKENNAASVLVTGSGQGSILERLSIDFPMCFEHRVTGNDVKHGKPDPEPYIMGMHKAEVKPWQCVAVDNAPLGVRSASSSGAFTVGVITGPLKKGSLIAAGADIEIYSMVECADLLFRLFNK